jgi:hypothetical protein
VKFGAFSSLGFHCKSLIISFSLRDIISVIHYDVTICMKLDPGIHIVKHLVFFGKSGVTVVPKCCTLCGPQIVRPKYVDS